LILPLQLPSMLSETPCKSYQSVKLDIISIRHSNELKMQQHLVRTEKLRGSTIQKVVDHKSKGQEISKSSEISQERLVCHSEVWIPIHARLTTFLALGAS